MASKVQAEKALRQQMEDEKNKTSAANQSEAVICIVDAAKLYKQELGDHPGLNVHTELGTYGDAYASTMYIRSTEQDTQ